MSDADDQLGGTGGEHGPKPGEEHRPAGKGGPPQGTEPKTPDDGGEETTEDSFPASDPPGNY